MKKAKVSSTYRLSQETRDMIKLLADYKEISEAEAIQAAVENNVAWCREHLKDFPEYIGVPIKMEKKTHEREIIEDGQIFTIKEK